MSELHRILIDPAVCGGHPIIRGMRIRVKDVLAPLAAGADRAEILADYPYHLSAAACCPVSWVGWHWPQCTRPTGGT